MPRPLLTAPTPGPRHTIATIGDSLSYNETLGVPPHLLWPELLAAGLRASGYRVRSRNFAKNGDTTTMMLARVAALTLHDVPKLLIIFAGVNDPGAAISQATTQANIEALAQAALTAGTGYVLVVSPQFLNYTSGGEATGGTKPSGAYAAVYDAQVAAVAALAAANPTKAIVFCDLWDFMRDRIVAGTDTLASASWHYAGTNQHFNAYGHTVVADAVEARVLAQSGWGAALTGN